MKKKGVYFIVGLLVMFSISNVYAAQATESGDTVTVIIKGYSMTLQEAINNDAFSVPPIADLTSGIPVGHNGNEIWISVNGVENMLQNAINDGPHGLCVPRGGASTTSYSGGIHIGHFGNSVNVMSKSGEAMTLQALIDNGGTCCVAEEESVTCSGECGLESNNCGDTVICDPCPTCSDGIQNQDETGVDCGGVCAACYVAPVVTGSSGSSSTCGYVTYGYGRDRYRVWECGNSNGLWDGGGDDGTGDDAGTGFGEASSTDSSSSGIGGVGTGVGSTGSGGNVGAGGGDGGDDGP